MANTGYTRNRSDAAAGLIGNPSHAAIEAYSHPQLRKPADADVNGAITSFRTYADTLMARSTPRPANPNTITGCSRYVLRHIAPDEPAVAVDWLLIEDRREFTGGSR
jgi:hypothetical protein